MLNLKVTLLFLTRKLDIYNPCQSTKTKLHKSIHTKSKLIPRLYVPINETDEKITEHFTSLLAEVPSYSFRLIFGLI